MSLDIKRPPKIWPLVTQSFLRCWALRDHMLRLGVFPMVVIVAVTVPLQEVFLAAMQNRVADPEGGQFELRMLALGLCYSGATALFAVNWVRQLTLGSASVPGFGLSLAARHLRFFGFIMAANVLALVVMMLVVLMLHSLGIVGLLTAFTFTALFWLAMIIRLSPSWIGIAIDVPMPLRVAWRRTEGRGFWLALALFAVELPAMLAEQLVTTLFQVSGLDNAAPLTLVLVVVVMELIRIAVQLAVLVAAYPNFMRETV